MFKELKDTPSQTGSSEIKNTEMMQVWQTTTFCFPSFLPLDKKYNWVNAKHFDQCRVALKSNTELRKQTPYYHTWDILYTKI